MEELRVFRATRQPEQRTWWSTAALRMKHCLLHTENGALPDAVVLLVMQLQNAGLLYKISGTVLWHRFASKQSQGGEESLSRWYCAERGFYWLLRAPLLSASSAVDVHEHWATAFCFCNDWTAQNGSRSLWCNGSVTGVIGIRVFFFPSEHTYITVASTLIHCQQGWAKRNMEKCSNKQWEGGFIFMGKGFNQSPPLFVWQAVK